MQMTPNPFNQFGVLLAVLRGSALPAESCRDCVRKFCLQPGFDCFFHQGEKVIFSDFETLSDENRQALVNTGDNHAQVHDDSGLRIVVRVLQVIRDIPHFDLGDVASVSATNVLSTVLLGHLVYGAPRISGLLLLGSQFRGAWCELFFVCSIHTSLSRSQWSPTSFRRRRRL